MPKLQPGRRQRQQRVKVYRCICEGCHNVTDVQGMTCFDCFLYCDHDVNKLSTGHRIRVRVRRRR